GLFAAVEALNGDVHPCGIKAQLAHDAAGGFNLTLGNTAVGFCDMAHHVEGGAEELLANLGGACARQGPGGVLVELMAEKQPQHYAERPQDQEAEERANQFARPLRHDCYSSKHMTHSTLHRTALRGLEKIYEGKVRDMYAVDAQHLLIVTT